MEVGVGGFVGVAPGFALLITTGRYDFCEAFICAMTKYNGSAREIMITPVIDNLLNVFDIAQSLQLMMLY
jgi:hypothetical protein